MTTRQNATKAAIAAAVLTLIVGGYLIASNAPDLDPPKKTTTVKEVNTGSGLGKKTTATEITRPAQPPPAGETQQAGEKTTTTVDEPRGNPSDKKTTTTEVSPKSFTERMLGDGGLVLVQIGILLLAAFLAAAFTQRLLVGDFALKLGFIELSALQEGAEENVKDLTAKVADLTKTSATKEDLKGVAEDLKGIAQAVSSGLTTIQIAIDDLRDRVAELEKER
jgi:hypothetical protein